jgi:hypothetical protein
MKVRRVVEQEIDVPDLGERLKQIRLEVQAVKGTSLAGVCKAAGISRSYWYRLEAEEIQGALLEDTLRKLESALSDALERKIDLGIKFND